MGGPPTPKTLLLKPQAPAQKEPAAAQPAARASTPKNGVPQQPAKTFVGMPPVAEPPRSGRSTPAETRHPPSEPPEFDIEIDDEGHGEAVQPPPRKSDVEVLAQVSKLLPLLAALKSAAIGKTILTVDLGRVRLNGNKVLLGQEEIGDTDGRAVRIWLGSLGHAVKPPQRQVLSVLESCFNVSGLLFQQNIVTAAAVSLSTGASGVLLCLHRAHGSDPFLKAPAIDSRPDKE